MKLQITIDGQTYEVEVEVAEDDYSPHIQDNRPNPVSTTIQSTVLRTPPKPGSSMDPDNHEAKLCRSPLAGIIVQVTVTPGQQLEVDDLLVVLEAMKMETKVTAPIAGTIKSVKVVPGEAVAANQILVDFE
jgi:methylmalonyl-CoA carboxyltransferase small subunit